MAEISAAWQAMSSDNKENLSVDAITSLKAHHENKTVVRHNVPLNAYQDTRATLSTFENDVSSSLIRLSYHS